MNDISSIIRSIAFTQSGSFIFGFWDLSLAALCNVVAPSIFSCAAADPVKAVTFTISLSNGISHLFEKFS